MKYEVSGYLKLNNTSESFDEHIEEFTDYNDAIDCYTEVFRDVASDIANIGGEFVLMLTKREFGSIEMLRRHTINTTLIND